VKIVYGANAQNMMVETMPLQQAFDKLIGFYSSFSKPTDRNVPRQYKDEFGNASICNEAPCYIKKVFKYETNKNRLITLIKEVPLWLAVDDSVQKGHQVQLITIKEYEDFTNEEIKKDIRTGKLFQEKKRAVLEQEVIKEELGE
jgi:hypothetical protein